MGNQKIRQNAENSYQALGKKAQELGEKHHGCAQASLAVLLDYMNIEDERLMAASSCLVGGSVRCLTCGPLLAGFMVFGIKYGRRRLQDSHEILDVSLGLAGELTDRFLKEYGTTNCCELTGYTMSDPEEMEKFFQSKEAGDACALRIRQTTAWIAEILDSQDAK